MTRHAPLLLVLLMISSLSSACTKDPSEATPESLCDLAKGIYGGTEEVFYKGICLDEVKAFKDEADSETFTEFATCVHDAELRADFRVCAKKLHKARVKAQTTKMVALVTSLAEKYCECETVRKTSDRQAMESCIQEKEKLKKEANDEVERMKKRNSEAEHWQMGKPMTGKEIISVMKAARDARKEADKACK